MMKCSGVAFLSILFAVAAAGPVDAQTDAQPANPQPASTQTQNAPSDYSQIDIAGSFYRAFTRSTTGPQTKQTPTDGNGGMFEARYLASRFIGFGLAISYNPANQTFAPNAPTCGTSCPPYPVANLKAQRIVVAPEYVPSKQFGKIRVFGVAGFAFNIFTTGGSQFATTDRIRPGYVFGGGSDFSMTPRFGVRAQFRYDLYKAPDIATPGGYPATGAYTSSVEPMVGVFYTF